MTQLSFGFTEMPGTELGPENPLPPLHKPASVIDGIQIEESVSADDRTFLGYGLDAGCLPYGLQDDYDRRLKPRRFQTAVLENRFLKAVFLTGLGGRLWSLFDKQRQRELVYVNPVFRLGNLAIRNAWFSGGIEWNPSLRGHSPFTCSPLFVASLRTDGGDPVLRMYEWERNRGIPFQMDFFLPANSAFLFVSVRLINPHRISIPMYWWSNVAIPENPACRVMAPATTAYRFTYRNGQKSLGAVTLPRSAAGRDMTYATQAPAAADYFFCVDAARQPWMAALDEEGYGLVQMSSAELQGRKLFVWGMGRGGRRWQEFLSTPGHPYMEIQAGVSRTQMECLPMPPHSEWSWVEAYGPLQADPVRVHGRHWRHAWRHAELCAQAAMPLDKLNRVRQRLQQVATQPVAELVQHGSGWGALERLRRAAAAEEPMCSSSMRFDDASLTEAQTPWLELLREGDFAAPPVDRPPTSWMIQAEWRRLMDDAVRTRCPNNWLAWLHLGVMRYSDCDFVGAEKAWRTSLDHAPSAWAYRNLAVLADDKARLDEAAEWMTAACHLQPTCLSLIVETVRSLVRAGRSREGIEQVDRLPENMRTDTRVQAVRALAALHAGELEAVERFLLSDIELASIREGEIILTDLWFEMNARRLANREHVTLDDSLREQVRREVPPPAAIDFRMFEERNDACHT